MQKTPPKAQGGGNPHAFGREKHAWQQGPQRPAVPRQQARKIKRRKIKQKQKAYMPGMKHKSEENAT